MSEGRAIWPVAWRQVEIADGFWAPRCETVRTVTLPLEYEINQRNGVLEAYQWDWQERDQGTPPWRIILGDLGKWIEAASYAIALHHDAQMAARIEHAVQSMLRGQKEDGYLYANPLYREQRWANLQEYSELYEAGHDIEAAVAHFQATGQSHFLEAMCRCADLLVARFGRGEGQIRGYDGHPEIELALVRLYRATGERRYLELAAYFVDERGQPPLYFPAELQELQRRNLPTLGWYRGRDYALCQAHKPVREQEEAVGHAVRALYLYSGMADVSAETGDAGLLATCRRLWQSVTHRKMYVTGGVGSTAQGEAFAADFDLPNETAYAETCANVALVFFAHRMLQIEADSEYADVMERALYNGVLSGLALDGRRFFYANPLSAHPRGEVREGHVATQRQEWFRCACCPPNVARLLTSLGGYIYSTSAPTATQRLALYVHLYVGGRVTSDLLGQRVTLCQETRYPWKETVSITLELKSPLQFALALRIPGWCRGAALCVNGESVRLQDCLRGGYAYLERRWQQGDRVVLTLPMPVERVEANPAVWADCGRVALQRGPLVYCLEEVDNGPALADLRLPCGAPLLASYRPELLGGVVALSGAAQRRTAAGWRDQLYRPDSSPFQPADILAVPYCLWANREPGEMQVWVQGS